MCYHPCWWRSPCRWRKTSWLKAFRKWLRSRSQGTVRQAVKEKPTRETGPPLAVGVTVVMAVPLVSVNVFGL